MSDEPENLLLVYLRRLDEKMDRLAADVASLGDRMSIVERKLTLLDQRLDVLQEQVGRIEARLDRIERRLDLVEAP